MATIQIDHRTLETTMPGQPRNEHATWERGVDPKDVSLADAWDHWVGTNDAYEERMIRRHHEEEEAYYAERKRRRLSGQRWVGGEGGRRIAEGRVDWRPHEEIEEDRKLRAVPILVNVKDLAGRD